MRLTIQDYTLYIKIGHFASEKKFAREVYLSLDIEFFLDVKNFDNMLQETMDYSAVTELIEDKFTYKTFDLIETLVISVGRELICHFPRINTVSVKADKSFLSKKVSKNAKLSLTHLFRRQDFL